MVEGISGRVKRYVSVTARMDEDGRVRPLSIQWYDGKTYPIDEVKDVRPAPPLIQARSHGTRHVRRKARPSCAKPAHAHLSPLTAACAGCGRASFAKKPAFLLAAQAEPAHDPGSRGGGTGRPPKDKEVFKMGNRAVITTPDKNLALCLHWNGGRDTVEPLLKYCELQGYRPPSQDCYVLALDVPLRVLPEGHRYPGGGVERAPAPCLEREVEDRVLLLLERADLPFEVDLLVEGEHHAGEFLLPAEMTTVLLGDADGELVGGGARILALSPRRAAPRGRLVEVVWFVAVKQLHGLSFVKRTAGPRGPRPYTGSSAGRASARATSCRRGSP